MKVAIYQSRQVTSYLTILGVNCAFGLKKNTTMFLIHKSIAVKTMFCDTV